MKDVFGRSIKPGHLLIVPMHLTGYRIETKVYVAHRNEKDGIVADQIFPAVQRNKPSKIKMPGKVMIIDEQTYKICQDWHYEFEHE